MFDTASEVEIDAVFAEAVRWGFWPSVSMTSILSGKSSQQFEVIACHDLFVVPLELRSSCSVLSYSATP